MANVGKLIEKALSAPIVNILRSAGHLAQTGGYGENPTAYLVGGPVRDLLLGINLTDIDITVSGNSERFGRELAQNLGGSIEAHSQFGTLELMHGDISVDIAMTRSESYSNPGALPDVESGSLDADLARRDFTVNSMAVDITPSGWGELIDNHFGRRDLMFRKLRVIHEGSFVDDPTRILRALRYEYRLGFQIESNTLEYMKRDAHYLGEVSGSRIFGELSKILVSDGRSETLRVAEERGILTAIHPSLRISARNLQVMATAENSSEDQNILFYVALISASLVDSEAEGVIGRLTPPSEWISVLRAGPQLRPLVSVLERPDLRPSEIAGLLKPFPLPTLLVQLALSPPTLQRERLETYIGTLQFISPECTGNDLIAAGVPQGPLIGQVLEELLNARIDQIVHSKQEELDFVQRWLPLTLERSKSDENR